MIDGTTKFILNVGLSTECTITTAAQMSGVQQTEAGADFKTVVWSQRTFLTSTDTYVLQSGIDSGS